MIVILVMLYKNIPYGTGKVNDLNTKEGKMKAVVSITLDNEFVVHDIKVI